jgi:hypothetical protein
MTRCSDHPKYKGNIDIKRTKTCSGCKTVREEYLKRVWKQKRYGTGSYPSITTKNYKCSLAHLFAEIGIVSTYGTQLPFFWRDQKTPNKIKKEFYEIIKVLSLYLKDPLYNKVAKNLVNRAVILTKQGTIIKQMEEENEIEKLERASKTEDKEEERIETNFFQEGKKKLSIMELNDDGESKKS